MVCMYIHVYVTYIYIYIYIIYNLHIFTYAMLNTIIEVELLKVEDQRLSIKYTPLQFLFDIYSISVLYCIFNLTRDNSKIVIFLIFVWHFQLFFFNKFLNLPKFSINSSKIFYRCLKIFYKNFPNFFKIFFLKNRWFWWRSLRKLAICCLSFGKFSKKDHEFF